MSTDTAIHQCTKADHNKLPDVSNDVLHFVDAQGNRLAVFCPPHVAEATAKAFNEAMAQDQDEVTA